MSLIPAHLGTATVHHFALDERYIRFYRNIYLLGINMTKKNRGKALALPETGLSGFEPFGVNFRDFFSTPAFRWNNNFFNQFPSVDLADEGDKLRIKADLPGIEKNDVKLNVEKNSITISANAKRSEEKKGKNYYYRERSASGYYRSIPLPTEVIASSAKAKFSNGTLEVTLNKKDRSSTKVKID